MPPPAPASGRRRSGGLRPRPFLVFPGPALERSPWEWLLGGSGEEERKWESRAPSTRGSIPAPRGGGSRAQTQTDRFQHTQTDSDTRRNPHAQRVLPFPSGTHLPPRDAPKSLWKPSLAWLHPDQDRGSSTRPTPAHGRDEFSDAWAGPRSHHHPWRREPCRAGREPSSQETGEEAGALSAAEGKRRGGDRRGPEGAGLPWQDLDQGGEDSPDSLCPFASPQRASVARRAGRDCLLD